MNCFISTYLTVDTLYIGTRKEGNLEKDSRVGYFSRGSMYGWGYVNFKQDAWRDRKFNSLTEDIWQSTIVLFEILIQNVLEFIPENFIGDLSFKVIKFEHERRNQILGLSPSQPQCEKWKKQVYCTPPNSTQIVCTWYMIRLDHRSGRELCSSSGFHPQSPSPSSCEPYIRLHKQTSVLQLCRRTRIFADIYLY